MGLTVRRPRPPTRPPSKKVERFTEYARAHRRGEKPPWNTRTPRDQWDAIRAGLAVFGSLAYPADGPE